MPVSAGTARPSVTGNATFFMLDDETSLTVTAPGALGAVTDQDNDPLTATLDNQPSSGNVTRRRDRRVRRTRARAGSGSPVEFDVTASDWKQQRRRSGDHRGATNGRRSAARNGFSRPAGELLCPASDPDGDGLFLAVTGPPDFGTATPFLGCFSYAAHGQPRPGVVRDQLRRTARAG